MNYSVATEHYVLSIDTDYCFVLISKGNTWRRTMDPSLVRAMSSVIPRLTPLDDALACRLYADLSPLADHEHKPKPVQNRSSAMIAYPPTGGSASTRSKGEPVGKPPRYWPEPLKAHSLETRYKSRDFYMQ